MNQKLNYGLLALLVGPVVGCSADSNDEERVIGTGSALQVYTDVENNPIPASATAMGTAWDSGGKLKLALEVAGFPADRDFGAHLHKLPCQDTKGGGHYQHTAAPTMEDVNTPDYANTANEAWLDFKTAADGSAMIESTQNWLPRAGEARSIIIHAMMTDENGRAGDKLACLPLSLP